MTKGLWHGRYAYLRHSMSLMLGETLARGFRHRALAVLPILVLVILCGLQSYLTNYQIGLFRESGRMNRAFVGFCLRTSQKEIVLAAAPSAVEGRTLQVLEHERALSGADLPGMDLPLL